MAKSAKQINSELYPHLYCEDVKLNKGENFKSILLMYGHRDAPKLRENIWKLPKNAHLRNKYKSPDELKPGDTVYIPIPPISHYRFKWGTVKSSDPIGKNQWPSHGWVELQVDRYGNANEK